jgi:hypothetical protein
LSSISSLAEGFKNSNEVEEKGKKRSKEEISDLQKITRPDLFGMLVNSLLPNGYSMSPA